MLLHSASGNASGIPQTILDEKAAELRKKKEMQDAINVRPCPRPCCPACINPPSCAAYSISILGPQHSNVQSFPSKGYQGLLEVRLGVVGQYL